MKPAKYLTSKEKLRIKMIKEKINKAKSVDEVQAYETSICLILERSLHRYRQSK